MWTLILTGVLEILKIVGQFIPWFLSLDAEMRKEVRAAWDRLMIAEKDGKRADIRSSVNRFNAVNPK